MADKSPSQIHIKNIGVKDLIEYRRADLLKISRVKTSFAFSFYQIDYQAFAAMKLEEGATVESDEILIPVAKIVVPYDTMIDMKNEFDTALKQLFEEIEKHQNDAKNDDPTPNPID